NSKGIGAGTNLIGPDDENQPKNNFFDCKHSIITSKDNTGLIIRCNNFDNNLNLEFESVLANTGVLGNQGEYTTDQEDSHLPAGNVFFTNAEKLLDADLQSADGLPTGFSYVLHDVDGNELSNLFPEGSPSVFVSEAPVSFNAMSCASVLQFKPDGNEDVIHASLDYDEPILQLEQERDALVQSIDGFNQNTQTLLDAIYGGINDELELRNFLQDNSPLSNQVLQAYMDRYGVPAEYFRDVVYMNSVVDRELHALLGQRILDLPQTISDQIAGVLVENPAFETLAETEARLEIYRSKRDLLFAQEIHELFDQDQESLALTQMGSDNSLKAEILRLHLSMENQNWIEAQSMLDNLEVATDELQEWKAVLGTLLNIHSETRWPCQVTEEEKDLLLGVFENSSPGGIAYGYSKSALRELGGYRTEMLLPQLVDVATTRSMEFQSLVDLVKVYPNPASNYVLIDLKMEKEQVAQFTIFGLDGAIVKQFDFNSFFGPGLIELENVATGAYTYEVLIGETSLKSGKLIIE
ncbi:MAG: T9SS type A sorting domain-containing protein, partial [Flavobacteriales bacterium]|nr:T9SS type A sorting domain-containing protein [Flavobacteriales bacterium]